MIQLQLVINKNRNDPVPFIDTIRVINKHGNDPNSVIDTVRVINKNRNDPTLSLIQLE